MASKPIRKRDRFRAAIFRYSTPQLPESSSPVATSSNDIAPTLTNGPDVPQKAFTKSKSFEKDIAVLFTTYILELDQNPELKRLILVIVVLHDKDEEGHITDVLETCARFGVQLASANEAHRAEAREAITTFIKTIEKLDILQLEGQLSHALTSMVDGDITKIKASYPFLRPYDVGTSEGISRVLGVAIGASIPILQIVKEASALAPVPWIKPLIGGVVSLLNGVVQTRSNYNDMREIAAIAGEFAISCAVICSDRTTEPSNELKRSLTKFTKSLEGIAQECDELSNLNLFWRYLQQNSQTGDLKAIKERLKKAIDVFQNESHVNIQLDIKDLSRKFDHTTLNGLPSHPDYNPNEYLPGSQNDVIHYISDWIDESDEFVLWMHGAAGLGKSTISQQLVDLLKSYDRLAGGVFLTNLTTEHPKKVIQMISKQLGEMHPLAGANIAEAARKLNGPHGALRDYFASYIIDPVRTLKYSYQLIIVVDALDEWTNRESFLAELEHFPQPSPLKFILTSRPIYSIERILNKIPLVESYSLPPASQETVERYFNRHFYSGKIDWTGRKPDERIISRLAAQSDGLLIWAATVCSLVSYESDDRYPHVILEQIISSEEKVGTRSGEQLERLYRKAIETLFPESELREKLRCFLGGMTVLQEALPIRDFSKLINMSDRPVREIERRLVALQTRQNPTGNILPAIQQFHFSLLEFIQQIPQHNEQPIAISSKNSHSLLANQCLKIVFSELLPSHRGQSCIHSDLVVAERYAVKFWPLHVSNASPRALAALSATPLYRTLLDISDAAMQRWGTLFLPSVATRFQDWHDPLYDIPSSELPYELAVMIGEDDISTLLYRIHCLEIAVRFQPIDLDTWWLLGESYRMLCEYGGFSKNLAEEIVVFRQVLELLSQKTAEKGSSSSDVGVGVRMDIGFGEATITNCQSITLTRLGSAVITRFKQQGTLNDLEEAISHWGALSLKPPHHAHSLNNLANCLYFRFEQLGASNDLEEAISLYREALSLQPPPHPEHAFLLGNLANSLQTRFEHLGISNDLDEAISLHRDALALQPPHPHCYMSLTNLAISLQARFEESGSSNDLDEAICLNREAISLQPGSHPNRSYLLHNLANSLQVHFEQLGTPNYHDEAISLYREALSLRPGPHPKRASSLSNLANSLQTRFEQQGILNDIAEAISLNREALSLRPEPHTRRAFSLSNLANSLRARFEHLGTSNDIDEAISLHRDAYALQPAPHPYCYMSLGNLATSLKTRFEESGSSKDLDEAISLYRKAILFIPLYHPQYSNQLRVFSISLKFRFQKGRLLQDIDEIISLYRRLIGCPLQDPNHSWALKRLPSALRKRYKLSGDQNDLDEARRCSD